MICKFVTDVSDS